MGSIYSVSRSVADSIIAMPDGSHTSIYRQMEKLGLKDERVDLFSILDMTEYLCAKQMVLFDFNACDDACDTLPYFMDFEVVHIGKTNAKHARLYPRYACVLHHPLQGCETWPEMNPADFPIDYAVVEFQGLIDDAIGRKFPNDTSGSFAFDAVGIGSGEYAVAFLDENGTPTIVVSVEDGEPFGLNVPLLDASEAWTAAVSESPLNISAVMDEYRLEDDRYISIEDEKERDEFFERFR